MDTSALENTLSEKRLTGLIVEVEFKKYHILHHLAGTLYFID